MKNKIGTNVTIKKILERDNQKLTVLKKVKKNILLFNPYFCSNEFSGTVMCACVCVCVCVSICVFVCGCMCVGKVS